MSHPTMEDVARHVGVSRALVSLVFNDSPKVSEDSRRRVLVAASELGYRRNDVARRLASRTTGTVGVLLNDLHNPFFAETYAGIHRAAAEQGRRPLLTTGSRIIAGEQQAVESMLEQRVDGMVLVSPRMSARDLNAVAQMTPVVVIGRVVRGKSIDSVTNDEHRGAELLVEHLHKLGHRRIVHIDGGSGAGARARRTGFERAMTARGLDPIVISGDYTEMAGVNAAREVLARRPLPTAVFGANDLVAVGVIGALEDAGCRVPDDISVAGYDNTYLAELQHIGLTSIDQRSSELGRTAMSLLLERVSNGRSRSVVQTVTPTLVVRRTSGRARRVRRTRRS
jgi:DNA-binding LacI/PurR family transcriptional regulator